MNQPEARRLAGIINDHWRNGLQTFTWEEELERPEYHDVSRAHEAFQQMKRSLKYAPVVKDFLEAYQAAPSSQPDVRTVCSDCGNAGWISDQENRHTNRPPTSASRVCPHCEHGRRTEQSRAWKHRNAQGAAS